MMRSIYNNFFFINLPNETKNHLQTNCHGTTQYSNATKLNTPKSDLLYIFCIEHLIFKVLSIFYVNTEKGKEKIETPNLLAPEILF